MMAYFSCVMFSCSSVSIVVSFLNGYPLCYLFCLPSSAKVNSEIASRDKGDISCE